MRLTVKLDVPSPYALTRVASGILVSRPEAQEEALGVLRAAGSLFGYAATHPAAGRLEGRGTVYRVPAADGSWVVRHFRRGGTIALLLGDRYLAVGEPRPFRELRASLAARARGVRTPEVVAFAIYPAGPFYRSDLVTRYVARSSDLVDAFFGRRSRASVTAAAAAGLLVRTMHERGVVHPDLNLKNILVEWRPGGPRAWLLDLDRCRIVRRVSSRQRIAMLDRFWRSWERWETRTQRRLSGGEREAFTAAYARDPERVQA